MKINFTASEDQKAIIQAIGSKNKLVSAEANEVFAATLGPVVQEVILQMATTSAIFSDYTFGENDNPEYPLDLRYQRTAGTIPIWAQVSAGGLASSTMEGFQSLKLSTYQLDSAVNLYKKYLANVRLPALAQAIEWMGQEITLKKNLNGWSVITKVIAEASTNVGTTATKHVIRANTAGILQVKDISDLMVRVKRVNSSFVGGSPLQAPTEGLTDLYLSPELKAQIRSWSWEPMNSRGVPNSDESTVVPLPDNVREEIFRAGGANSLWGIQISDINELGQSQLYNTLFASYAGSTTYAKRDGTASATFSGGTEEVVVGFDMSRDSFIRPVITDGDSGGTVTVQVDDQFVTRSAKVGWFASTNEGALCVDGRGGFALIV